MEAGRHALIYAEDQMPSGMDPTHEVCGQNVRRAVEQERDDIPLVCSESFDGSLQRGICFLQSLASLASVRRNLGLPVETKSTSPDV